MAAGAVPASRSRSSASDQAPATRARAGPARRRRDRRRRFRAGGRVSSTARNSTPAPAFTSHRSHPPPEELVSFWNGSFSALGGFVVGVPGAAGSAALVVVVVVARTGLAWGL